MYDKGLDKCHRLGIYIEFNRLDFPRVQIPSFKAENCLQKVATRD